MLCMMKSFIFNISVLLYCLALTAVFYVADSTMFDCMVFALAFYVPIVVVQAISVALHTIRRMFHTNRPND